MMLRNSLIIHIISRFRHYNHLNCEQDQFISKKSTAEICYNLYKLSKRIYSVNPIEYVRLY